MTSMAMKVNHDLHIHTILSSCCRDSFQKPEHIISFYENYGMELIGFSDHVWQNPKLKPSEWYSIQGPTRFNSIINDLKQLKPKIRVLRGCEADTLGPGRFSITPEFASTLDYVLLAANHFHFRDVIMQPEYKDPYGIAEHMITMFIAAISSGFATIIPHVFMPMGFWDVYDEAIEYISDNRFVDIFSQAAARNVGIEISLAYFPPSSEGGVRKPWKLSTPLRVLALAKRAGCKFTFASDGHSLSGIRQMPMLQLLVDELGIEREDIHPIARPG